MRGIKELLGFRETAKSSADLSQALAETDQEMDKNRQEGQRLRESWSQALLSGDDSAVDAVEAETLRCGRDRDRLALLREDLQRRLEDARQAEDAAAAEGTVEAAEAAYQKARRLIEKDYLHHALAIERIAQEVREIQQQIRAANEVIGREGLRPTDIPDPDLTPGLNYALPIIANVRLPDTRKAEAMIWPAGGLR